jgi:hypothetical protein
MRRRVAIAAVAIIALGVGVLAAVAILHANPTLPTERAAAVPTFTLGVQTETPRATPTATPAPRYERESERFLATASGTLWRAVAGACRSSAPVIERSNDGGASWTDVTPHYVGVAQVASLDGIVVDAVEAVAGVGRGCETQVLRSFTNGEFWKSFPEVLTISRYVDLADPATVHLEAGPMAAPCPVAHGMRAWRERVALICDDVAYVWRAGAWAALPGADAVAIAVSGSDLLLATVGFGCPGLALTRFAGGNPAAGSSVGCAQVTDAAAPAAIVAYNGGVLVWSGDQLVAIP